MNEDNQTGRPRSRVKKKSYFPMLLCVFLLVGSGAGYYIFLQFNSPGELQHSPQQKVETPASKKTHTVQQSNPETTHSENSAPSGQQHSATQPGTNSTAVESLNGNKETATDNDSVTSETFADTITTTPVHDPAGEQINELNDFYSHLDQQEYMKQFGLSDPSKVHFSKLLQKLIDNPPTVARETDDLFTLLKNTAHFFRILGKDNIIILKGILDREKSNVETVLKSFYSLTDYPDRLKQEYQLSVPFESLYDYAGFFLNTMGGRLYLFRRDSTSRMVVSYYAILIIEKANSVGNSSHGIDLVPAVDFLIDEMETGGKNLEMREEYLDTLYDLKEKYN